MREFTWAPKAPAVYLLTNLVSGKLYVGSTGNLRKRFKDHSYKLNRGVHQNAHLQASWHKYGAEAFRWDVLEIHETAEVVVEREQFWMDALRPEYNKTILAIGVRGTKRTQGQIKRISEAHKGYAMPAEQRRKISESNRGKVRTPEHRAKYSLARRGKLRGPLSPEDRQRLGDKLRASSHHLAKTHCPQGHEYAGRNLMSKPASNGRVHRACRTCHYATIARRRSTKC